VTGTAEVQGPLWGARAREWSELQEPVSKPLFESVLARFDLGEGVHVLDVGCGTGLFCELASEREGGSVAGIDASEASIAIAKERTPEGDFRVGEIEQLPWAEASFDVVTGFNSFQFAASPANALREALRVARPDGEIVAAVWGRRDQCEAAAVLGALAELLPPPPPGTPGPFALSEPGALESLFAEAGLTVDEEHEIPCPWVYEDLDTAVLAIGSAGPSVRAEGLVGRETVEQAIAEALQPFHDVATGIVQLENVFRYAVAPA
jgi:SAM-dependent methyltransferase